MGRRSPGPPGPGKIPGGRGPTTGMMDVSDEVIVDDGVIVAEGKGVLEFTVCELPGGGGVWLFLLSPTAPGVTYLSSSLSIDVDPGIWTSNLLG